MMIPGPVAAHGYVDLGWPVLPLRPLDKRPLLPSPHAKDEPGRAQCRGECGKSGHGYFDATLDHDLITRWWRECPDANIGIALGGAGLAVIDVDPRNGGDSALDALVARVGEQSLGSSLIQRTPSGGRHFIFADPGVPLSRRSVGASQGIDIKVKSGYIAVAPSIRADGRYEWLEGAPGDLLAGWPNELLPSSESAFGIRDQRVGQESSFWRTRLEGLVGTVLCSAPGARNNCLYWAACRLMDLPEHVQELAADALVRAALDVGLTRVEAAATVRSALKESAQ